jgi:hypothetical protein
MKKDNKWLNNERKYKPQMTDILEETEPESSFKETKQNVLKKNKSDIPEVIEEDRDDDFSDDSDDLDQPAHNELKDFTFIPGSKPGDHQGHTFLQKQAEMIDTENMSSADRIKEYLSKELGQAKLAQIQPILRGFGDDILL